jgi:hypothetical protein
MTKSRVSGSFRLYSQVALSCLVTSAAAGPSAIASAGLGLVAGLAKDGTIASWLKWHRGLLAASSADHGCSLRRVRSVSAAAPSAVSAATTTALVVILFRLTARLAPLRRRVAALAEKGLVGRSKGEFLSTVAASELQVPSHSSSFVVVHPVWRVPAPVSLIYSVPWRRLSESLSSG